MFFYEGLTCPVCNETFREGEDIVSCPQCGLPHHRACWMKEGHCHLDTLHGTDQQWTREKAKNTSHKTASTPECVTKRCSHCGGDNVEYAEFCTRCGRPLQTEEWSAPPPHTAAYNEYRPFQSPYRGATIGFSPDENIGGYRAKDLAVAVGSNATYYIPRFRQMANNGSGGWNWAAFIFGPIWLLYRKNYLLGALFFVIQTIFTFASNVFLSPIQTATTIEERDAAMGALIADPTGRWMLLLILLVSVILLVGCVLLGCQGNRLYFRDCRKRIDDVCEQEGGFSAGELAAKGGVSTTVALIAYFIPSVIAYIIALLEMM